MNIFQREIHVQGKFLRVAHLEGDKYETLDDPAAVLELLRRSSNADLFTFMQIMPDVDRKHAYPMELDNLAVLPISTFDHWWTKQINNKTRNMVRRGEKSGVTVREVPFDDTLVAGITAIYNEVPTRQGKSFPHYGKDFDTIRRISGTFLDQSVFIGAFFGDRLIGFVKLVTDKSLRQGSMMHVVSLVECRDKAPTNALIAQTVRSCAARNIPHLVYSNFAYGKKQRDTLSDFKEYNGFQRVDLPRYHVPLTFTGNMALRLGLHKGLSERIPESLQTSLRNLRTRWHGWKAVPRRHAAHG